MPTWVLITLILAPILAIGLNLMMRKPLKESVKKRRVKVSILFLILVVFLISITTIFSIYQYGDLSGIPETVNDFISNPGTLFLPIFVFVLFIYQFFRKDKKSQDTSDQSKRPIADSSQH